MAHHNGDNGGNNQGQEQKIKEGMFKQTFLGHRLTP